MTRFIPMLLAALLCMPISPARGKPLATSYKNEADADLTPVSKGTKKIVMGKDRTGNNTYVLVRNALNDFSLMLKNNTTGKLRKARGANFLSPSDAMRRAQEASGVLYHARGGWQESLVKLREVQDSLLSANTVSRDAVRFDTIYRGLTKDGLSHIVEFRPKHNPAWQRKRDSHFINISTYDGRPLTEFIVPYASRKRHVAATWQALPQKSSPHKGHWGVNRIAR